MKNVKFWYKLYLYVGAGTYEEVEGMIFFHVLQPYQNENKNIKIFLFLMLFCFSFIFHYKTRISTKNVQ